MYPKERSSQENLFDSKKHKTSQDPPKGYCKWLLIIQAD